MSTLTRRDRVALGGTQGGALYYGDTRRWPEPAPGVFEKFGITHPGSIKRGSSDTYGHNVNGFIVSDLDGTPKLYTGYGRDIINVSPVYIWPLGLDSTWDAAPAHTFQVFGNESYLAADGKLFSYGHQGSWVFCTGSPGGTWVDGKCDHLGVSGGSYGGMTHPSFLVRHDGYTWIAGQHSPLGFSGAVWRGADPTGIDGEYVWGTPLGLDVYGPYALFSYQGKVWMRPNPYSTEGFLPYEDGLLCYWDETEYMFVPTDILLDNNKYVQWKDVMIGVGGGGLMECFDGTSVTTLPTPMYVVRDIFVTPDDTVWIYDSGKFFHSSTDLVTWNLRTQVPSHIDTYQFAMTFTVHEDYIYIGDMHDQIWRCKVAA